MDTTDEAYMFRQCVAARAEVELYAINNAPATLSRTIPGRAARPAARGRPAVAAVPARVLTFPNTRAVVMHAHRRDYPQLDAPPNQGCSSKLAAGPLVAHNRYGLADNRQWGAAAPQIVYGDIYQWWERDPDAHPTLPGNQANAYPEPGHYPDDRIFSSGYGTYPPGHPGNSQGLQPPAGNNGNNSTAGGNNRTAAAGRASSVSSSNSSNASGHSRNSSNTSNTSVSSNGSGKAKAVATKPFVLLSASGKSYGTIRLVSPYARIPAPSPGAIDAAKGVYSALSRDKTMGPFVAKFNAAWDAFIGAWRSISRSAPYCDDALACTLTAEFQALMALATSKTARAMIALSVYRLAAAPGDFVGIYVYNALERNGDYMVHKKDMFNYNVLQRHANLIVEMNGTRAFP